MMVTGHHYEVFVVLKMVVTGHHYEDFEPGSGAGLTDTDDEDLVGSGSGLSGSGDGVIFDTDQKPTPTTASTTTVNITTTSRPKSICEKAYQTNKLGILHYMPKCLPNGDYAALQCYGQQGSSNCFCSDHSGKEIPGTLMEPPNYPECDNGENLNPCVFQVVKFFRLKLMGTFYPKCTREGQFEKIQCHENLCYCVNPESGEKILGTEAHFPVDHKHCEVDTGMGTSQKTSTSPEPEVEIPETNLDPDNEDSSPTDNDDEGDTIVYNTNSYYRCITNSYYRCYTDGKIFGELLHEI
ncbi:hypothetical protein Btru_061765 [Bulinus truncatus]|nr:hypothetical protein Btru_061765 [Bulinus truncatus]